jgi:hypothetical protein
LDWKSWELRSFLAGTTLGTFALSAIEKSDDVFYDDIREDIELQKNLRKRYQSTVVPYLIHLNTLGFFGREKALGDVTDSKPNVKRQRIETNENDSMEHLYEYFTQGCKCISTRAFHMQSASMPDKNNYQGPYLLTYIDLLNHAPHTSLKHATTLQRDPVDGSFFMLAERDIEKGEEICHSYDSGAAAQRKDGELAKSSSLTSAQLLQTFGFVDVSSSIERLSKFLCRDKSGDVQLEFDNMTPAMLSKNDICRICKAVSTSSYPNSLRNSMEETGLVDEGWEHWELPLMEDKIDACQKDCSSSRQLALESLPDEVMITTEALSDEIITICSLNFLPDEAIDELCGGTHGQQSSLILSEEVLDDYFLGKLVLYSLMKVLDEKLEQYQVCFDAEQKRPNESGRSTFLEFMSTIYKTANDKSFCWGGKEVEDLNVLSKLSASNAGASQENSIQKDLINKFMYGMTVSLDERICLLHLKKAVLNKLLQLDECLTE